MFKNIKSIYHKKNFFKSAFLGLALCYGIFAFFIGINEVLGALGYQYTGQVMPVIIILFTAPIAIITMHYLNSRSSSIGNIKLIAMMLISIAIIYVIK